MADRRPSKRSLLRQAQRLRNKPGWNPRSHAKTQHADQLRAGIEGERVASAFDDAEGCPACAQARRDQNDPTALCDEHLRRAMGL